MLCGSLLSSHVYAGRILYLNLLLTEVILNPCDAMSWGAGFTKFSNASFRPQATPWSDLHQIGTGKLASNPSYRVISLTYSCQNRTSELQVAKANLLYKESWLYRATIWVKWTGMWTSTCKSTAIRKPCDLEIDLTHLRQNDRCSGVATRAPAPEATGTYTYYVCCIRYVGTFHDASFA